MELINNVYSHHQFTHYCIDMYGEVTTPSEIKCMIEKFHEHIMDPNDLWKNTGTFKFSTLYHWQAPISF